MLCYEQEGPCWKAGLIPVYPGAGMVHSKRAGRENLYIQTLSTRSIRLPRNTCGNGMDPPRAWLLGFFLLAEVLALSRGYFKKYLLLPIIFTRAFLFQGFL